MKASPSWILKRPRRTLGGIYHVLTEINRKYYEQRSIKGQDVATAEWDNLIILDGCRYDLFESVSDLPGNLSSRRSRGSSSSEFLNNNFVDRGDLMHDTVYITANAHAFNLPEDTFHAVYDLLIDEWNKEYETVLPEAVVDRSLSISGEYPDKRFVIHFMQPHYPFIGEKGRLIDHSGIRNVNSRGEVEGDLDQPIWWQLKYGEVDPERVYEAYRENLEIVLPHVRELIDNLLGKTVVTSDHGNLLGDWIGPVPTRGFGHPRSLHVNKLVKVPWLEVKFDDRRTIKKETPISVSNPDQEIVDDRLRSLGYLNAG